MGGTNPTRATTAHERFTWGTCPVCKAEHGEDCNPDVGLQLGVKVDGSRLGKGEGAHVARLQAAPMAVALVPLRGSL